MQTKTIVDVFVDGARKGWNVGISSILPNVLMAFALIQILKVTGLLTILGKVFGPVMALFGLPGEAVTVLMGAWLSMGGGIGVAASLYTGKILSATHVTILLPAIILMGAQIQYMGRLLGTAGVQTRYYPMLFGISVMNAVIAMLIMRFVA
ncbi:YjiG family protein [Anaeroselena agilis]|uniref:YjiG family protein n=1 Tax=Anaeroselena agilis TaxID=3063788 RepID=A0ABU3P1X9_9FIRM|nr:YjiG family protein [Selenomonadales bacterium 4137-cl]